MDSIWMIILLTYASFEYEQVISVVRKEYSVVTKNTV